MTFKVAKILPKKKSEEDLLPTLKVIKITQDDPIMININTQLAYKYLKCIVYQR